MEYHLFIRQENKLYKTLYCFQTYSDININNICFRKKKRKNILIMRVNLEISNIECNKKSDKYYIVNKTRT